MFGNADGSQKYEKECHEAARSTPHRFTVAPKVKIKAEFGTLHAAMK